jgi:hypothetical protein
LPHEDGRLRPKHVKAAKDFISLLKITTLDGILVFVHERSVTATMHSINSIRISVTY